MSTEPLRGRALSLICVILLLSYYILELSLEHRRLGWEGLSWGEIDDPTLIALGARIRWIEPPWRLLSCGLIHAGPLHLGLNLWALWLTAPVLERRKGAAALLCTLTGSVLAASLCSWAWGGPLSVGISGGIFGLLVALSLLEEGSGERGYELAGAWLWPWILGNLILGWWIPGVDAWAHLGGAIAGLPFGLWCRRGAARSTVFAVGALVLWASALHYSLSSFIVNWVSLG